MARPIWRGSLAFGLVNVPVGLYAATDDRGVHFHQFERGTADRVRYRRVNERTGAEVDLDHIVRGVEVDPGEHVMLEDEEIDAVAPERSRSIEITDFVDLDEIDPVHYRTAYYLGPQGEAAGRAYALLRRAMEDRRRVGIACFVLRGKEHLVAVRPDREVLALETMYFADEIRDPRAEIPDLPEEGRPAPRELEAAGLLIDSLTTAWDPTAYHASYRERLQEVVDRKHRGEKVVAAQEEPERTADIVSLMDALDASLKASRSPRRAAPEGRSRRGGRDAGDRSRRGGETGDLAGKTKAELAAMASDLGIAGRSKMDRDELERAVRRASRRRAS
ncbi:MAG: Ku protein [Acidimicrobiales bacterium]